MDSLKTTALTFITVFACVMLLLMPEFRRDDASTIIAPAATQSSTASRRQPLEFTFGTGPTASPETDRSSPVEPERRESFTTAPAPVQAEDWQSIFYPELGRIAALENQPAGLALAEIFPMLSNDDPAIRLAAIEALGDMTIDAVVPILSTTLNDPNPQIRIVAIEALASHDDKSSVGSIEPYLYDQDRGVRLAAIEALASLESETAVFALASLISDPDATIRNTAINALGEIGGKAAALYLEQARYDPDPNIRANATDLLSELADLAGY